MGRPPSNGGPAFRFTQPEVTEMEAILSEHNNAMPARDVLQALADKFSESPDRKGKITVQNKQVWNWFQNKRYAIRAKTSKTPAKLNITPMPRVDLAPGRIMAQPTASPIPAPSASVQGTAKLAPENSVMEFEAKSGRDGAWYDVANFLSYRHLESSDPEVLVRFSGFGSDEDEWINVRKNVRPRSLPCESSECVAVLAGDLILCFQEGKEQALYFDAHVLDAQRRRHDVRGCRCRFLVRYDHDQSEEIVTLRKVCRRPETDYRLHQLHAVNDAPPVDHQKISLDHPANVHSMRVTNSSEMVQKQQQIANIHIVTPVLQTNVSIPPQSMNVDPVKIETKPDIQAGNPITLGTATFNPSVITTSSVPEVSTQNLPEEK
ncbi:protein SAWADEE HOMEODOMAIN HOMOLOG 2-like isoform X2 [Vicia villosa]|uniref:protein SAWADEE HOMEODOMAIN HOMOLOG 2-like isoform X2 n=1 Tax=Vicia villosa TaxID=3911 RepID=UPI00273AC536|nr:protein SAWADEE HOMEODOMAIN HOMOLOG 2-like isoform X2 [Vicia villosa]XP_058747387.1 protein SAWADEE HOMEODOMAIN HOMOLOG 2-like isoform X2 [Vicia villosa]